MKKKWFKKILLLFFAEACLVITSCSNTNIKTDGFICDDDRYLSAFNLTTMGTNNATGTYSTNLDYKTSGTTAVVSIGTCTDTKIVIPSTYVDENSVSYTIIGVDTSGFTTSTTTIPVRSITSITFSDPSTITTIGSQAFKGTGITSFTVPKQIVTINPMTFMDCRSLASIDFTIDGSAYDLTGIGDSAFEGDNSLASITFPNTVATIGNSCFKDCIKLANIFLPNNLASLGQYAFENCSTARQIYMNTKTGGITTKSQWGDFAFKGCTNAENISLSGDYPTDITVTGNWNYLRYNNAQTYITITVNNGKLGYSDGFYYNYKDDVTPKTCTISKYDSSVGGTDVVIPRMLPVSEVDAYQVVGIKDSAFLDNTTLTSITIGDSTKSPSSYLTEVSDNAFKGCKNVTKVDLSNAKALTTIGSFAFNISKKLDSTNGALVIPASVQTIGDHAFYGLGFTSLTFVDTDTEVSQLTKVDQYAFESSSRDDTGYTFALVLPRKLTTINTSAFAKMSGITSITFKNTGNLTIGPWAFSRAYNCLKITFSDQGTVTISGSSGQPAFEFFGGYGYEKYETLSLIYVPKNVTIDQSLQQFQNSSRAVVYREATGSGNTLSSITMKQNPTYGYAPVIPQYWNVDSIIISNYGDNININTTSPSATKRTIVRYQNGTNGYFDFLTTVDSTDLVLTKYVYKASTGTENTDPVVPSSITINGQTYYVKTIGYGAFYDSVYRGNSGKAPNTLKSLKSVTLPDTITSIGSYAFGDCAALTTVSSVGSSDTTNGTLPTSLTSIGVFAFANTAIQGCTFPSTLTTFCTGSEFGLSSTDTGTYSPFGINSALVKIDMATNSNTSGFTTYNNNAIYKLNGTTPIQLMYVINSFSGILTIPDGVTTVPSPVLYGNTKITGLVLPRTLTSIPSNAFTNDTGLSTVSYSSGTTYSTTSIGSNAFNGCSSLTSFEFANTLTTFSSNAFFNSKLESADLSGLTATSFSFQGAAFGNCSNLKTIKLPTTGTFDLSNACFQYAGTSAATTTLDLGTVATIGSYAFYGCTNIKSITIPTTCTNLNLSAFNGCTGVTTLDFAKINNVTDASVCTSAYQQKINIKGASLANLTSLTSIVLPYGTNFNSFTATTSDNLPFSGCSDNLKIYLCIKGADYKTSNYPANWNSKSYDAATHVYTNLDYYFYAENASDITTVVSSPKYWHYDNGVPTEWTPS